MQKFATRDDWLADLHRRRLLVMLGLLPLNTTSGVSMLLQCPRCKEAICCDIPLLLGATDRYLVQCGACGKSSMHKPLGPIPEMGIVALGSDDETITLPSGGLCRE